MASELLKRQALNALYRSEHLITAPANPSDRHEFVVPRFLCRYCGRAKPEVGFKTAHVLAEALGNHRIVSDFECTLCNEAFSDCEGDLVAFLGLSLAIAGVEGKNRTGRGRRPTYKHKSKGLKIFNTGRTIVVKYQVDREGLVFDPHTRRITLDAPPHRYVPTKVFRALYKAAVAALPYREIHPRSLFAGLEGYDRLITAVNPHTESPVLHHPATVIGYSLPGYPVPRVDHAKIHLICRKGPRIVFSTPKTVQMLMPSRMAIIQFGFHVFQLPIFSDFDLLILERTPQLAVLMPPYPFLLSREEVDRFGPPSARLLDLNSAEPVRPASQSIVLQGEGEPVALSVKEANALLARNATPFDS